MSAARPKRIRLFAFLAAVSAALAIAAFALRPSRAAHVAADSEPSLVDSRVAAASDHDPRRVAAPGGERARSTEPPVDAAGAAALAQTGVAAWAVPRDPDEIARKREEYRKLRVAQRAAWEERGREHRAQARAHALERAKGNPELVERLEAQYARQDERDRLREERRQQSR